MRYIGSMVADFHRNLLSGGIFFTLPTPRTEVPEWQVALAYEGAPRPFSWNKPAALALMEAKTCSDVQPTHLHQRTQLFIGNRDLVEKAEEFIRHYG